MFVMANFGEEESGFIGVLFACENYMFVDNGEQILVS